MPLNRIPTFGTLSVVSDPTPGAQEDPRTRAKPNYSLIREKLLHRTPPGLQCKLFCGGKKCKYCAPESWTRDEQMIMGLYSSWVTSDILAMSRPTSSTVAQFGIVDQFLKQGITSIINLQRSGEHEDCGPGLTESGFLYLPEDFMSRKIFHYNFGWPDFGVGSAKTLLDMVKVMHFALLQGKVAIHCHAGLGRTGVLICAYLIWQKRFSPGAAIRFVRVKRPKAVQTSEQVDLVYKFAYMIEPLRKVFVDSSSLDEYCSNQRLVLHGYESRVLKNVPKFLFVTGERILELIGLRPLQSLLNDLELFESNDDCFYDRILEANTEMLSQRGTMQGKSLKDPDIDLESPLCLDEGSTAVDAVLSSPATLRHSLSVQSMKTIRLQSISNQGLQVERLRSPFIRALPSGQGSKNRLPPIEGDDISSNGSLGTTGPDFSVLSEAEPIDLQDTFTSMPVLRRKLNDSIMSYIKLLNSNDGQCWSTLAAEDDLSLLILLLDAWFGTCMKPVISLHLIESICSRNHSANHHNSSASKVQRDTYFYICSLIGSLVLCDRHLTVETAGTLLTEWILGIDFKDSDFIRTYVEPALKNSYNGTISSKVHNTEKQIISHE